MFQWLRKIFKSSASEVMPMKDGQSNVAAAWRREQGMSWPDPPEPARKLVDRGVEFEESGIRLIPVGKEWPLFSGSYKQDGAGNYRFSKDDAGRTVVIRYSIGKRKLKKVATL